MEVLIRKEEIEAKILELAEQISQDNQDKPITAVILLKGGVFFGVDLIRYLPNIESVNFLGVSSYEGQNSKGKLDIYLPLNKDIAGKNILLIEDIIDTGTTLKELIPILSSQNPNSIKIVTLLNKPSRRLCEVNVDYVGFEIENHFVIGYGLDFDEKYREICNLCIYE